ncbi:MAG TPA: ABC transporter ATP-binding protein, partial [Candidatus Methylomirabilis sp.]|nr:ABC transporter ATP-binding protein [Candidatus Methylomirabilis sp.]
GEAAGIVGESGCGKSTLAKCIAGLVPVSGGRLTFRGADIARPVEQRDAGILRAIRMVFQNPDATLNPSHTVGYALARPLRRLAGVPRGQVDREVHQLLRAVQLDEMVADRYPEQLSGGQKQRVAIARAFAGRPALVLCDEPVSALDVSVQASVLQQLREFQRLHGTALLFISHDLGVVRALCETIAVMYLGQLCEVGRAAEVFAPPFHPYTEALLSAVPVPDPRARPRRIRLEGPVPSALNPPVGCRFHTRCPRKVGPICETTPPPEQVVTADHRIACHIPLPDLRRIQPVLPAGGA